MSSTETKYRSRYGYDKDLPERVTYDDLANVESSLSNLETQIADPNRKPRFEPYSSPGEQPRQLPNGERIVRFDQLSQDQQHERISKRLNEIAETRRQTFEHAKDSERRDLEARSCRWCHNVVAKQKDLGMITWNGVDHDRLCVECIAVAFTVISVQAQTVDRMEIVLDQLRLTDQR